MHACIARTLIRHSQPVIFIIAFKELLYRPAKRVSIVKFTKLLIIYYCYIPLPLSLLNVYFNSDEMIIKL